MANGTVKWFDGKKCYGFIIPDDGGADVFVHLNNCRDVLDKDQRVQYEIGPGRSGPCAVDVRKL